MFHATVKTTFQESAAIAESPMRRAMVLGAMFATASQGALPLVRALAALRHDVDADCVTLLRIVPQDGMSLIATTAAQHTVIDSRAAAFAKALTREKTAPTAGHILRDAADRDQCAVVLAASRAYIDLLVVRDGDAVLLADFAAMAAPIWAARRPGIGISAITALQSLVQDRPSADTFDVVQGCILSTQNPAGLTPMEFRVALALRDGLSPATIGETLSIAMPTVRTHLRNLYAKTGLRGMRELTHRMHADAA